jgi:hypothetical protein
MASLERQIIDAVEVKLEAVRAALGWGALLVDPSGAVGQDQMNALVLATGAILEPDSLTGGVQDTVLEFEVGMVVAETAGSPARDQLDAGLVAVVDALIDPTDIQLGGLAKDILRGAASPIFVGRGETGSTIVGVRSIGFFVKYWAREGDASSVGP